MPDVHVKKGYYTIGANDTSTFTFWWDTATAWFNTKTQEIMGSLKGCEGYFDVSITLEEKHSTPLVEVKREWILEFDDASNEAYAYSRQVLLLTLQNNNDIEVGFWAWHLYVD